MSPFYENTRAKFTVLKTLCGLRSRRAASIVTCCSSLENATDITLGYRNASPGLHTLSLGNTGNHIFVIFFSDCSLIFNSPISCSLRFYACTFLFRCLTCQTLSPLLLLLLRTKSFFPQLENLLTLRSQYTLWTCKA